MMMTDEALQIAAEEVVTERYNLSSATATHTKWESFLDEQSEFVYIRVRGGQNEYLVEINPDDATVEEILIVA